MIIAKKNTWKNAICKVKDCESPVLCRGLCHSHYGKFMYAGKLKFIKRRNGEGTIDKQGYKKLVICGRVILEHRLVMENHVGRPLEKKDHVHHINGNKLDNRIDNLIILKTSEHRALHNHNNSLSWNKERKQKQALNFRNHD